MQNGGTMCNSAGVIRSQMLYPVELRAPERSTQFAEEECGGQIMQKTRKISGRLQDQKRFAHTGLWI